MTKRNNRRGIKDNHDKTLEKTLNGPHLDVAKQARYEKVKLWRNGIKKIKDWILGTQK